MHASDLVGISTACERLSALGDRVERSALSRYIKNHAIHTIRSGRESLVSFRDLVNHRRTNELLGPAAHALPYLGPADQVAGVPAPREVEPADDRRAAPETLRKADGQSRKWAADADLRELELAEATGKLLRRDDVEMAAADAVVEMKKALYGALNAQAEAMAVEFRVEGRRVRHHLRSLFDAALESFREAMEAPLKKVP